MSDERWNAVDELIGELTVPADPVLDAALEANAAGGLPRIDVSPPHGKLLWILARAVGARKVLEIGTLGGYSTIWLARALPSDGQLITLEAEPAYAEVARQNLASAGLSDVVDVRVGRALDTLPQVAAEGIGPFDLIFIDADKAGYPEYLPWALELSRPGSLIVGDNVIRDGAVLDPGSDASAQGSRRFLELLGAEPRLEATALQTVGSKGYDGLAIALVTTDE